MGSAKVDLPHQCTTVPRFSMQGPNPPSKILESDLASVTASAVSRALCYHLPWEHQYRAQRLCTLVQRYPPCNRRRGILEAVQGIDTIEWLRNLYFQLACRLLQILWKGRNQLS